MEALAKGEGQPIMTNGHPIFKWSPVDPILDEDGAGGEDHDGDEVDNDGLMYDYDMDEEEAEDNDESIVGDAGLSTTRIRKMMTKMSRTRINMMNLMR